MTEKKGILSFLKSFSGDANEEEDKEKKESIDELDELTSQSLDKLNSTVKGKEKAKETKKEVISDEIEKFAIEKCQEIITLAGFQGRIELRNKTSYILHLDIHDAGDDLGRIIGRNGTCLQAIQILVKFFIIRKYERSIKVIVDAGDYKNRHQSQVKRMALKAADKVIAKGDSIKLEPMNANDRRVIHVMFENHNDIVTESEGEGDNRCVVLKKRNDS